MNKPTQTGIQRHEERTTPTACVLVGDGAGLPGPQARLLAAGVERDLRAALGHDQVKVLPRGRNLLTLMGIGPEPEVIDRITQYGPQAFGAAFRSHSGRWDPLPVDGSREEVIEGVVSMLGPYLSPENY